MLRVVDLLSLPQFETFQLISDADGLNNMVSGTGILEWETPQEIDKDFCQNDFVITTLYMSRNNVENANEGLKALIKKRVAAIAIKSVYFDTCSQEVIELANIYRIPIFIYKDTYMEDLIYTIKSAIFSNNANTVSLDYLKFLMESSDEKIVSMARKLNPLFYDNLICFCCIPAAPDFSPALDSALDSYRKELAGGYPYTEPCDSFIRCGKCILIIRTTLAQIEESDTCVQEIEHSFGIDTTRFRIGISRAKDNLSAIREAIDESIAAAMSAISDNERYKRFEELGIDTLIIPNLNNKAFLEFYERTHARLADYDAGHSSNLMETLLCYIESEGNVGLTAKKLFQHGNTIRYKLDKIKTLLGISASPDAYVQLYLFAKMHKLYERFGTDSVI